jgi:urocanate hydratase
MTATRRRSRAPRWVNIDARSFVTESRTEAAVATNPICSPRGTALSCKGWHQEGAMRMFMNSVDPGVAERPEQLIPSGGIGKMARDAQAFQAIVNALRTLEEDETLLIQSGQPVAILQTHNEAPRVLIINSSVSPTGSEHEQRSAETHATSPTDSPRIAPPFANDWMFTGTPSALPETYQTFRAAARKHFGGSLAGRLVVAGGMGGMGGAQPLAATLLGGAFLGIDVDARRIKRRVKTGYCEVMVNDLDEALRILKNAVRKREPASVGVIGNAAEIVPELASRGVVPDLLTDQTPADDPLGVYIPRGLTLAQAEASKAQDARAYYEIALDSMAAHVLAMLKLKTLGSVAFEFGNGLRAQAFSRGVGHAYEIPDFASEYLLPDFAQGRGLLTLVPLSGDHDDLARADALCLELFSGDSELRRWIAIAARHPSQGLPARSVWIRGDEAAKLGVAINSSVERGEMKAPVAMGRNIRLNKVTSMPTSQAEASGVAQALADWPEVTALLHASSGASWIGSGALPQATTQPRNDQQSSSLAIVADGKSRIAERIDRLFGSSAAGYTTAQEFLRVRGVRRIAP